MVDFFWLAKAGCGGTTASEAVKKHGLFEPEGRTCPR